MDIANKIKGLFDSPEKTLTTVNRVGPPVVIFWTFARFLPALMHLPRRGLGGKTG